jgi:hypothetical protein
LRVINPTSTPQFASTPMSTEDRAWLPRAAELQRPLARAAKLGMGNGMGYAVFGGFSLVFACLDWDIVGLILGAVLLGVGLYERAQSKRLLQADTAAPRRLACGELVLLGAITLYGVLGLTVLPAAGDVLQQQLGGTKGPGLDVQKIANFISTIWYTTAVAISLLYQGAMARYFLKRRSDMTRYLEEVPAWAREVVESMAK